jgi:hypothetical protein
VLPVITETIAGFSILPHALPVPGPSGNCSIRRSCCCHLRRVTTPPPPMLTHCSQVTWLHR